jgi:hypothetical protein
VTDQTTPSNAEADAPQLRRPSAVGRTFLWVGIGIGAVSAAALTYFVLRATVMQPRPAAADETADRIQVLIDEANRLIKTLDEKKQA